MSEKESAEHGFMATLDGTKLSVTDSDGGGYSFNVYTRDEAVDAIAGYIGRCAEMLAEQMADDLFDDSEDDESDEEQG